MVDFRSRKNKKICLYRKRLKKTLNLEVRERAQDAIRTDYKNTRQQYGLSKKTCGRSMSKHE